MPLSAPDAATRPLEQLALIRNGFVPRQLSHDPFGEVRGLQMRDLAGEAGPDWSRLISPRVGTEAARHELRDGDVVVNLRGAMRAWRISAPPPRVIVVGQLTIVTPHAGVLDPDYLCWRLNHRDTHTSLRAFAKGTSLSFVPMADLRRLEIEIPPLPIQRSIGRAAALARSEQRLQQQLSLARRTLVDCQLLRATRAR
ncbi:MAG: restriction endonuclease subunit S [Candidatus Eisenbacteria bacterium]|nr:restriction endonuclease subunit S [Candidatus Eisenbacteria bacterium]